MKTKPCPSPNYHSVLREIPIMSALILPTIGPNNQGWHNSLYNPKPGFSLIFHGFTQLPSYTPWLFCCWMVEICIQWWCSARDPKSVCTPTNKYFFPNWYRYWYSGLWACRYWQEITVSSTEQAEQDSLSAIVKLVENKTSQGGWSWRGKVWQFNRSRVFCNCYTWCLLVVLVFVLKMKSPCGRVECL